MTPEERADLKLVKTTNKEAMQILERNLWLWDTLQETRNLAKISPENDWTRGPYSTDFWSKSSEIGCPHCIVHENTPKNSCAGCRWLVLAPKASYVCINTTFNGVALTNMYGSIRVTLGEYCELIIVTISKQGTHTRNREKCEKFILGHLEWALYILTGKYYTAKKSLIRISRNLLPAPERPER